MRDRVRWEVWKGIASNVLSVVYGCPGLTMSGMLGPVATVSGEGTRERTKRRVAEYQRCGRTSSNSNMTRHQRSYRVWHPGDGLIP